MTARPVGSPAENSRGLTVPKVRQSRVTPVSVHYAGLVVAAVVLVVVQSNQWFHFDEWAFLKVDPPPLLDPHLGHLSIAPNLIIRGLFNIFHLHTYWPYVTVSLLVHLAVVHLTWRVLRRVGVGPWIATALAGILSLLGSGSENLLWAFQMGFMGAIALGLGAVLVVDRSGVSWPRVAVAGSLVLVSLTFSGTSIPMTIATALVVWRYGGWVKAAVLAGVSGGVYLLWYIPFAHSGYRPASDLAIRSADDALRDAPEFFSRMFVNSLEAFLPVKLIAPAIILAVIVWLILRANLFRGRAFSAFALGVAALAFAAMTTASRLDFGMHSASSGRYTYAAVVFCLAIIGLALTEASRHLTRISVIATLVVYVVVLFFNIGLLVAGSRKESQNEFYVQRVLSAALALNDQFPGRFDPDARPTPELCPDLTIADLVELDRLGYIDRVPFEEQASDLALEHLTDPNSVRP